MSFKELEPMPDFPAKEREVLKWWYENGIAQKYLHKNNASKKRFSFLDGPITANNPMGVHHAWGRTLKDFFQRYQNMLGAKQRFQNGFDNQGLWVEVEVEKALRFKSKKDIERYGIDKFVEKCKEHTLKFAKIQTEQSKRLGYFMDWDNSYYTLSDENNYAIWHFLKKVWQDGNLYQGRDSVPWCPRCGTAISQHEILTEEYQEITHKTVIFKLPIGNRKDEYFLAWTTTPWTIPGNVALAIDSQLTYVAAHDTSNESYASYILEKSAAERLDLKIQKELKGQDLVGLEYEPPHANFPAVKKAFGSYQPRVVAADPLILPIDPLEGTGIVHVAPGAGSEDFRLGKKEGLPAIEEIDESGVFLQGFEFLSGLSAQEASQKVLTDLESRNLAFNIFDYLHRYPVCWRCKTELLWRVVEEWYIAMDDKRHPGAKNYRGRLINVIKNVKWIPPFGYDRELDWLKNMEDWLISKKRYWGLALPIWECSCGHFEVLGSREELQERAIEGWEDFEGQTPHRPWVDAVKIKCSKCGKAASRIPDVGNPWLDAGIVSFSTLKYFEDKDYWWKWFPVDLVLESFPGQFKNWFYSLLAMSVVLENKAPFRTLFGHALVKDEKGEEMHKSKGNAIWFDEAAEKMGVDIMRWLYLSQNPEIDLRFGYTPAETVRRRFFLILWNVYKFFVTYANLDGFQPSQIPNPKSQIPSPQVKTQNLTGSVLDQWVLSKLHNLIKLTTENLDNYDTPAATRALEGFVVADLSTWYIRRSRDRVGPTASDDADKESCHTTLYQVLTTLISLLAPFTPFIAEEIYQNLKGQKESVHLENWPKFDEALIDEKLVEQMEIIRQIVEKGHAARKEKNIKVRQPLRKITVKLSRNAAAPFYGALKKSELIKDELNVKEVELIKSDSPELFVEFDTQLSPDLILEGLSREIIREIQSLRAKANYPYADRIKAYWQTQSREVKKAIKIYKACIEKQTLSQTQEVASKDAVDKFEAESQTNINGNKFWLSVISGKL